MSEPIVTSLGRVQPLWKGLWVGNVYQYLDIVSYGGNSYISLANNNRTTPGTSPSWQIIAHKGDVGDQGATGSFGTPSAIASILPTGSNPTVLVSADPESPDTAKVFNFEFGIPAGPYGFDDVSASASGLPASTSPSVVASLATDSQDNRILQFEFGIPAANGQGISSIDGLTPTFEGSLELSAVRYANQSLLDEQKAVARNNIGAIGAPAVSSNLEYFLCYDSGDWVGKTTNEIAISSAAIDSMFSEE